MHGLINWINLIYNLIIFHRDKLIWTIEDSFSVLNQKSWWDARIWLVEVAWLCSTKLNHNEQSYCSADNINMNALILKKQTKESGSNIFALSVPSWIYLFIGFVRECFSTFVLMFSNCNLLYKRETGIQELLIENFLLFIVGQVLFCNVSCFGREKFWK